MEDTRIIIPAAGTQSRWNNYRGTAKHMAPIHGLPLIHRTIKQLRDRGASDVILVAHDESFGTDWCPSLRPSTTILPDTGIGHSGEWWSQWKRTTVMFGDVAFSDAAVDTILAASEPDDVQWFGRLGPSQKTGHPWKELFALSFLPHHQQYLLGRIKDLREILENATDLAAGGWPLYGMQAHSNPRNWTGSRWFTVIDDETDDMDTPEDYERWIQKFGP